MNLLKKYVLFPVFLFVLGGVMVTTMILSSSAGTMLALQNFSSESRPDFRHVLEDGFGRGMQGMALTAQASANMVTAMKAAETASMETRWGGSSEATSVSSGSSSSMGAGSLKGLSASTASSDSTSASVSRNVSKDSVAESISINELPRATITKCAKNELGNVNEQVCITKEITAAEAEEYISKSAAQRMNKAS